MKKTTRKIISILLAVLMMLPAAALLCAAGDTLYTTTIPTVYLAGQGTKLWGTSENGKEELIYPFEIPDGYIGDRAKELISPLLDGIVAYDWDEYCDTLSDAIIGIVGSVGLDENGEPAEGQHAWPCDPKKNVKTADGRYTVYSHTHAGAGYVFNYDWRTDPYAVAKDLNTYIEAVKRETGFEKVNLVGRCLGATILLVYLSEYGNDSIEKTVLVSGGFSGFESMGALFSGNFQFDSDALTRFADDYLSDGDKSEDLVFGLLDVVISLLNQVQMLGMPVNLIDQFWSKVSDKVIPKVLLASYGSMPSFWSFVSDEYYDDAKEFLFGEDEEKYAGLIEKIDHYHYDVAQRYGEIIDKANADGNQVSIISKYGLQIIPIVKDPDIMSDGYLETVSSSFGATCSTVNGTLDKDYLAEAKENGTDKYISVDKQIDASTCRYRDRTWFIKYMAHMDNPDCINDILCAILDYDGDMTVFDDEAFPQYLFCEGKEGAATISPLTKENSAPANNWSNSKIENLIRLLVNVIEVLIKYLGQALAN